MTQLQPGELRVMKGGVETRLAVGEGFVEIGAAKVSVLTDMAVRESDIDEAAAEEAIRRAEAAMSGKKLSDEEFATTSASSSAPWPSCASSVVATTTKSAFNQTPWNPCESLLQRGSVIFLPRLSSAAF